MRTETERQDTRKAMAFDLCEIIDEDPSQETYTKEEIKKLIRVYVTTADQKWGDFAGGEPCVQNMRKTRPNRRREENGAVSLL